jgi:hypothetical protein
VGGLRLLGSGVDSGAQVKAEKAERETADAAEKAARQKADSLLQPVAEKGQAGGYPALDGSGHVPTAQMPVGALTYLGLWDASTNTPGISDATGAAGDEFIVSVGGKRNLGSGSLTFTAGSIILHNGSVWQQIASPDSVASVFGRQGAVVPQAGDYNVAQVAGLEEALDEKQDASTAATDTELATERARAEAAEGEAVTTKQIGSAVASFTDGRLEANSRRGLGIWFPESLEEARPSGFAHFVIVYTEVPTHAVKGDILVNPAGA